MRGRGTDENTSASRGDEHHDSDEALNLGNLGHLLVLSGRNYNPYDQRS
jgi:hypothetical protein